MTDRTTPGTRHSIATVCLSGTLEDRLAAAAWAGFDGVEIFENDLVSSWLGPRQVREVAADNGLAVDLYQPFRDAEGAPADRFRAVLRRFDHVLDVMTGLGTDTVLVCSSVAPDTVDDDALAAEQLSTLADRAADRGLRIAYEALAWGRHVSTWDHSWRIVRDAAHPALGLCVDSFHVLSRGSDPAGIADVPGERIFFVQLADAPRLGMDVLPWSRHHRLFPGQGDLDVEGLTRAVLATGYSGPLSLEVFNDVFRQADPWRTAVDARRSLLALGERLGTVAPPPAPAVTGHAFTEVGVDDAARQVVTGTLAALGFTRSGRHRSKPVELWEQGSARVVVTADATAPARVRGLGLESADPAGAAARAEALLAPRVPLPHAADEADLAAVAAPDGTEVYFCRTDAGPGESWHADFVPTGDPAGPGSGIVATDHVALTQPFDHFDEAGLFYRAVLGLADESAGELAGPFGLVRTHSVRGAAGRARLGLSVSLLRRGGWAPAVADPQHVAFRTDDLLATARALRDAGAPVLAVPANYYADLGPRLGLAPEFVDALRTADALYDRDADGAFLHLYTDLLGGPVFFEVVQRVGGYQGYGAPNAPVRMAAHRRAGQAARSRSGTLEAWT